jgi:hypothetical protein
MGLANVFWTKADSKHLRLPRPSSLCFKHSILLLQQEKWPQTTGKRMSKACVMKLSYKSRWSTGVSLILMAGCATQAKAMKTLRFIFLFKK